MEHDVWSGEVEVSRPIRFLCDREAGTQAARLVVVLHGYGMQAAQMLDWTRQLVGEEPVVVAVEAPNAAYLGPDPRTSRTGYNWGIRETTDFHVLFHHRIVRAVLEWAWLRFPIGAGSTILAGFSQPVGLNYRFAAAFPEVLRGILALCGGVPDEWDHGAVRPLPLSILHVARIEDEFYPAATIQVFEERLRRSVADVQVLGLPGAHRFPMRAAGEVRAWLERTRQGGSARG